MEFLGLQIELIGSHLHSGNVSNFMAFKELVGNARGVWCCSLQVKIEPAKNVSKLDLWEMHFSRAA